MRICYIIDFFVPHYQGGGERRLYEIAKRMVKKGHDVDVLCMKIKNVPDYENIDGINVYHIGPTIKNPPYRSPLDFLKFIIAVFKWLMKNRYDVVDAQAFIPLVPASLCYIFRIQKNVIGTIHDVSQKKDKSQWLYYGNIAYFIEKFLYKLPFKKIITVSNIIKNILNEQYGIPNNKIYVVYNGVDLNLIDSIKVEDVDTNSIIFVGRLIPHKHVDDLIKAVSLIVKDIPEVKLKIIGDGIVRGELETLVKELKLENNVKFFGKLDDYKDVIREIKKSEVLVLPSTREGFGMVLVEANACYKPVIAYKSGGVIEVIDNNCNGFLMEERNIYELSEKIKFLLKNKNIAKEMGKCGRKKVERMFVWDRVVEEIEKVYKVHQN
ncbi:glycosyl transferase group 1 [Methanocaldococcus vulcanius M7]|uniref:Glycosyl transferase group 1 n=1 Tax=Methanocaldococcus vulcanius (strain ATCC 700851 / DSM 12094 / M7) TaxID=579137 RepID=C9REE0_METVM|nr:glycosyltransferase family 4 protein [Methanocaldococcus vulcanius]ACX71942.1 glycosyl transferase group 1 [Methanocaldococcus vulcanius M7]